MTSSGNHSHSTYYHEDELASPSRSVSHSRTYEQVQHHQHHHHFQARLAQSTDTSSTVGGVEAGEGAMFYPPSSFAPTRMAIQQFSTAPTQAGTTYHSQPEYLDSEVAPSTTNTSASAYYSTAQTQGGHSHAQFAVTPLSAIQSDVHAQAHQGVTPNLVSAEIPSTMPASGPANSGAGSSTRSSRPIDPPSPTNLNARRHTTADIGKWKMFSSGPFSGRMIRAEIKEVQKADLGRKCADPPTGSSGHNSHPGNNGPGAASGTGRDGEGPNVTGSRRGKEKEQLAEKEPRGKDKDGETKAVRKDRRPLDPPPVVELKFLESVHHGTPHQYEHAIPAEEVEIGGLICQVDLFRVTIPPSPTEVASLTLHAHATGVGTVHGGQSFGYAHHSPAGNVGMHPHHAHGHPAQSPYEQHSFSYPPHMVTRRQSLLGAEEENANDSSPLDAGWESASPVSPMSPYAYHSQSVPHHPAHHPHPHTTLNTHIPTLHNINSPSLGAPIDPDALPPPAESDKLSRVLFGESYSHACSILDLHGRPVLYFVFSDLSVKLEGLFRPRYRFFDLFSRTAETPDVPILAQCFGGAFAVYSTKEFPGLKASTPLTKHLSRWGIRVNIRETERKRRAPDGSGEAASPRVGTGAGGGRDRRRAGNEGGRRKARGGSVAGSTGGGAGASSGASVRGEDEGEETGSASSPVTIPRGVDAPKRYLEGTSRGRGGRAKASAAAAAATGISSAGDARGRGRSRGD